LQTNERQLRAELQDKIRELAKAQKDVAKLQAAASSSASSSSYRSSSSYTG
jgi:hypothetical protein